MPETLTVQIEEKAPQGGGGPPRGPGGPDAPAGPGPGLPSQLPSSVGDNGKKGDTVGGLLGQLGLGDVGGLLGEGTAGLAAAAGPVGVAFAAAKLSVDTFAGTVAVVNRQLEGMGRTASSIAGNDYFGAMQSEISRVRDGFDSLPLGMGKLQAAMIDLVNGPVKGFHDVLEAFNRRSAQLARYSPDLAVSRANADVRNVLDDLREAQQLGPDLSRLVDAQSNLGHELRELLLPIKEVIVRQLAQVLETVSEMVRAAKASAAGVQELREAAGEILGVVGRLSPDELAPLLKGLPDRLETAMRKALEKKPGPGAGYFLEQLAQIHLTEDADRAVRAVQAGKTNQHRDVAPIVSSFPTP